MQTEARISDPFVEVLALRVFAPAKGERITVDGPNHAIDAHEENALHHDAKHVLLAHQSAIKHGETRSRHEQYQRGSGQHPCIIASELGGRCLFARRLDRSGVGR